ncbi:MAG TPA: DUF480 domain-containing protein, partial [Steroidobacteraceae bacterium]|nr:DUF480 domain-containing protein [Steroidobacteraceae bacterium]
LRSRATRLASFTDVSEVEAALQGLLERESGPLVARLAREPGRRESRYMHLFGGEPPPQEAAPSATAEDPARAAEGATVADRVARLEEEVRQLRAELDALRSAARAGA